jgi:hypothetical protein
MQRRLGSLDALGSGLSRSRVLGSGVLLVVACSADASENFFGNPDAGALAGLGGRGGNGSSGSGGGGGSAGTGSAGAAGVAGAGVAGSSPDAGPGPGDAGCSSDSECDDQNACTLDHCDGGACVTSGFAVLGATCGSALNDECTDPDTCDDNGQCSPNDLAAGTACGNTNDDECANPDVCGNGVCLANDVANGSACTDGSCAVGPWAVRRMWRARCPSPRAGARWASRTCT